MGDTKTNKLTAKYCDNANIGKHADGGGLYLLVNTGGKYWRYDYRIAGKRKTAAIGVYPAMSLKAARLKHALLRSEVAQGVDPMERKKQAKEEARIDTNASFAALAGQWFENTAKARGWSERRRIKVGRQLNKHILPVFGGYDVRDIRPLQIVDFVQGIDQGGHNTTAHDCLEIIRRVCAYAVQIGIRETSPAAHLKDIISKKASKPMTHTIDPKRIGEILLILERAQTTVTATKAYILLAPMLFTRPGELRTMKWAELQADEALWIKPASTMKKNRAHAIPLPRQAQAIIEGLRVSTGHFEYVFTNPNTGQPISDGTAQRVKIRNGLHDEITWHGWRHTASTLLNEKGFDQDHIELQLAHVDRNTVRGTYNHAQYIEQRREMMQQWADYLDELKAQALDREKRGGQR